MNHEELRKLIEPGSWSALAVPMPGLDELLAEHDAVVEERDRLHHENSFIKKCNDELTRKLADWEEPRVLATTDDKPAQFLHAASLPDDDEPITAEWAESPLCSVTGRENVWLSIYDGCFEMMIKGDRWTVLRLPAVRTRGDARALVKLLGRE